MSAVLEENSMHNAARATAPVVVVGTGPVGIHFTAIYPDVGVAPVCVSCHNGHKDSPRRDFKLGDVMGGVVIRIPLEG